MRFTKNDKIEGYHQEVDVYEVYNKDNEFYALLYNRLFPRPGKTKWRLDDLIRRAKRTAPTHIHSLQSSKPTASYTRLTQLQEVTTLFHEFGYALHGMLANTNYAALSGTSVFWDFVELPSQIMKTGVMKKKH